MYLAAFDRAAALEVMLDSGAGTAMLSDVDNDGVIEFDTTVGGVFFAQGIVKEDLNQPGKFLAIAPLSPFPEAIFRNVDSVEHTFTVTVQSTAFAAVGPPLGWDIFYNGTADDTLAVNDPLGVVGIPTHTVQALVNAGATQLGLVAGTALSALATIDEEAHGVDQATSATDSRLVWTFTLGPDDEIRVPSDNGFDGDSIQVNVFNQSEQCVDRMNNDSRKLANKAQRSDAKCVAKQTGDVTACVDDPDDKKTDRKEQRLLDDFAATCNPVPAWGVNPFQCCEGGSTDGALCNMALPCTGGGDCVKGACISAAAENAANDVTHDLFGATVNVSAVKATRRCQKIVAKTAGKLLIDRWKVFRKCKKDNFTSISDDADLVSTCCGPPQPDPKGKIDRRESILADKVSKVCLGKGVTSLGTVFPGSCAAVSDSGFAACVAEAVACRFCQSINSTDAISPPVDCDVFDDGAANSSCSP